MQMNPLLILPYAMVRFLRIIRQRFKVTDLRLRGVLVGESAVIHPGAIIEPSGGKIVIGARTFIDNGVILRPLGGRIEIGDDCAINAYSVLYGGGGLTIGNEVRIAAHTVIVPSNHIFANPSISINDQGLSLKGIEIENDVWIGAGARILDGVRLSQGTVVGAGAVVTRTTEAYSVVVGAPALKTSSRKIDNGKSK